MSFRRREENLDSKIIIRNYADDLTERDLQIMFEKYGKVEDCKLSSSLCYRPIISIYLQQFISGNLCLLN